MKTVFAHEFQLLPSLLLLALPGVIQAQDYTFTTNSGTIAITGYTGPGGDVTIPDTITGLPVTSIGAWTFVDIHSLTNITIPNGVISIGTAAFWGCIGLKSVMVGDGVSFISESLFHGCAGLTSVTMGNGVTYIGSAAFSGCTGLNSIPIGNAVTHIGSAAFSGCIGLTSVTIPNSVAEIEVDAFSGCTGLTSVTIPNSVTTATIALFSGCTSLTNVTIPNCVTAIGGFLGCTSLKSITIPNSVITILDHAFYGCIALTSITIPNSVTDIEWVAFFGCTGLTNVAIPNSVTHIGKAAFSGCTGLRNVTIGNGVINMDYGAFLDCTGLTSAYFEGNQPLSLSVHVYPTYPYVFGGCPFATVFYRAGASGWGATYELAPTAVWVPRPSYADWAVSSGLTAQFPAASGVADDPDGDGVTNGQEWFADTDPTQNTSRLQLELIPRPADLSASDQTPMPAGQRAVYFRSVPGRYYGVQSAVDLGSAWELHATRIAAPGTTQTRILLPIPGPQAFYRVEALP